MIYKIECDTGGTTYTIADSSIMEELPVLDPVLHEELNNVPSFTFALPSVHPTRSHISPMVSVIRLYIDGSLAFIGRPLAPEYDWNDTAHYECEGVLAYLNDTIMRPYGYSGTISFVLGKILTEHNSHVENRKKIQLGTVDVTGNIAIEDDEYSTCMDALGQVLEAKAGCIKIRVSSGTIYLDYLQQYTTANTQPIRFGENLLDLKKYQNVENIKTALIPIGKTLDDGSVVNIKSVNGNVDYIYNQNAVNAYGWIWATATWDAIDTPAALLTKAQSYLNELVTFPETVEVSAVDLASIDEDIERFKLGGATTMISLPHGISKTTLLTEKETHLNDPAQDKITIGASSMNTTLTSQTANTFRKFSSRVASNASSASRFSQFSTGGLGGYVMLDYANGGDPEDRELPYRILIMDSQNKATARNVLQLNRAGIGFSSNGVNGTYYNSWTIDGQLSLGGTDDAYGALRILNPSGGVIGKWDKTGITVNQGKIDLLRGASVGLKCDGNSFQFGDFIVDDGYGRQILQSSDDKTGMSGEPDESGKLYLWAGYVSANSYAFVVNNNKETRIQGHLFVNGTDIMNEISDLWDAIDAIDSGGGPAVEEEE